MDTHTYTHKEVDGTAVIIIILYGKLAILMGFNMLPQFCFVVAILIVTNDKMS